MHQAIYYKGLNSSFFCFIFLFSLFSSPYIKSEEYDVPVLYKGRYRSLEAYTHLWLYEHYHASALKNGDLTSFYTTSKSASQFLWSLEILGHAPFKESPLFWIGSAELKKMAGVPLKQDRFSYRQLSHILDPQSEVPPVENKKLKEEWSHLLTDLKDFEQLHGINSPMEEELLNKGNALKTKGRGAKEIARLIEQEFPLAKRLEQSSQLFKMLPSRYKEGDWLPLKALKIKAYDQTSQQFKLVGNFTLYSDEHFDAIRQAYVNLEKAFSLLDQNEIESAENLLSEHLANAYQHLAGSVIQQVHGKQLHYPSLNQLRVETLYVRYPWIAFLILIYGIGASLLLLSLRKIWPRGHRLAIATICFAVACHTLLLVMRSYILQRPPVSNMFETVIYVPWVAACAALLFPLFRQNTLALLAASLTSIGLLIILEVTDLNQNLDQVQAVLDSQFWLLIHVLLVVGSYGMFIFGAILGHFYLGLFMIYQVENNTMKQLSGIILQTLYTGTAMLIAGTILGGIWAAESWGRFWDWDPKESWAFISSCFYLIWIHAYRFHRIASFGLAIGAVGGLIAISFTWYGVNYILGSGLHSYGFGSGGEHYYYAFIIAEGLFIAAALLSHFYRSKRVD
ncbi:MAG: cytochrome c biogenesis protein [Parachlamydiaceae bacterium]